MSTDVWTIVSGVAAVASAVGALAVYRGQTRQVDHELARTLHLDLTTGDVARARDVVTSYRYGSLAYDEQVRSAYFTLLWCFERVYQGRRSMLRSRGGSRARSAAVRFLDSAIGWHVAEWEQAFEKVRASLRVDMPAGGHGELDDANSHNAFAELLSSLRRAGAVPPASAAPAATPTGTAGAVTQSGTASGGTPPA
jgi:hypothetical protein